MFSFKIFFHKFFKLLFKSFPSSINYINQLTAYNNNNSAHLTMHLIIKNAFISYMKWQSIEALKSLF